LLATRQGSLGGPLGGPRYPRRLNHRRQQGGRLRAVLAVALLLFVSMLGAGVIAGGAAIAGTVEALSANLPDPALLLNLTYAQPTIVYDRTGKIELARFQQENRRTVSFDELPHLVLDATTTAEDRSFWQNSGFDPAAIVSALAGNAASGNDRGASTITQQLVRARLLPPEATAPGADRYLRKAEEIIQAARLTERFPGDEGKQLIITSYLNQNFYGHGAYGIAAAAKIYFGVGDLNKLTPAQAALLAALPKSPSNLDPYLFAKRDKSGKLVVDPNSPPVLRRDWVLQGLASARWTQLTPAEIAKAEAEPIVLVGEQPVHWNAPQFVWQVRQQLIQILGSPLKVDTGGYRVITTLDWGAQQLAEKYITAAAILPNLNGSTAAKLAKQLKLSAFDRMWSNRLRGTDIRNGAIVALDYQTGDVIAYTGSAGYYRDSMASAKFAPKYDVLSDGYRQPGSAFKPIVYVSAFEKHALTPGSLLLDVTTQFGVGWAPHDADNMERGPVLVRKALQYSLNIPAIRALERVGNDAVADQSAALGISFLGGKKTYLQSSLAGAIGTVEVHPIELTAAYGALANGGRLAKQRMVLQIDGPDGKPAFKAGAPQLKQAADPASSYLITDILAGNTDPSQNKIWSTSLALRNGPKGQRRPAGAKTGTTNETRDFTTFGFIAPPKAGTNGHALAVGVWMGNSDHSQPRGHEITSLDGPARVWQAFLRDYTKGQPITNFAQPPGLVRSTIDAWSGGRPGPWTKDTTQEWFLAGTQPGGAHQVDQNGLLYKACPGGQWGIDLVQAELGPSSWNRWDADWMSRASKGAGIRGKLGTQTTYLYFKNSWGGSVGCRAAQSEPKQPSDQGTGGGGGPGGQHCKHDCKPGGGGPGASPAPTPAPQPTPNPSGAAIVFLAAAGLAGRRFVPVLRGSPRRRTASRGRATRSASRSTKR
jgi:membrane peptidoglycan carboxypeptidase